MTEPAHLGPIRGTVIVAGAALVTLVSALTLAGWILDLRVVTAWRAGTVPMAPAAAVLSLLFVAALLLRVVRTPGRYSPLVGVGVAVASTVAALVLLLLRLVGVYWPAERLGLHLSGVETDSTIGFISPITAGCLAVAHAALIGMHFTGPNGAGRRWLSVGLRVVSGVVIAVGLVLLLVGIFGPPLLVSEGILPVAVNASLIVLVIGILLLAMSGRPAESAGATTGHLWQGRGFLVAIFAAVAALTISGGYAYYRMEEQDLRRETERELELVSQLTTRQLIAWRRERTHDADTLSGNPSLSRLVQRELNGPDNASNRRELQDWLTHYQVSGEYDSLSIIDANRQVRLSMPPGQQPGAVVMALMQDVLATRQPAFGDFFLAEQDDRPRLAMLVPIMHVQPGQAPIAVLVLRIDPVLFLYPLLEVWRPPTSTAETLLVRRDGANVQFLNPLRSEPQTSLRKRISLADDRVLAVKAIQGQTGLVSGLDYRGVPVIGVLRPIPDSPWHLIARKEIAEFRADLWSRFWTVFAFAVILLFGVGSGLSLVWRDQRARSYRDQARLANSLRDSEERLRLALASAAQGIWDLDLETGEAIVSPEYASMLGYESASFHETHEAWLARLHPDDRQRVADAFQRYLTGHSRDYAVEFRQRTRGGDWKWILSAGKLVPPDEGGAARRILGTHTDITARKHAELRSLRLTRLYAALSQCNEAIVRCRTEDELFPVVCQIAVEQGGMAMAWVGLTDEGGTVRPVAAFGAGASQVDGLGIRVGPAGAIDRGPTATAIAENRPCWDGGDLATDAESRSAPAKSFGWGASGALPLIRGGTKPVGALTLYTVSPETFTEDDRRLFEEMAAAASFALDRFAQEAARARAEAEIARSKERLELATRAAGIGIWDWDITANRFEWDDRIFQLYGLQPHRNHMSYETWLAGIHPDDRRQADDDARRALLSASHYESEFRVVWPDGTVRRISALGQITTNALGEPTRMLGVNYDVTDRWLAERALRTSLREKEALLKEVHHRVKNNLQVIMSLLRLEAGRLGESPARVVLREMQGRIGAMALLHESLYRSRNFDVVDLSEYLGRICRELFHSSAIEHGGIQLSLNLVSAPLAMHQAIPCGLLLHELVSNSLKHGFPDGRVGTVSVSLQPLDGGPRLLLQVSDTGVGLPTDFDERRLGSLGLQLVTDLTRQIQGTLTIAGAPGATFTVAFTPAPVHNDAQGA